MGKVIILFGFCTAGKSTILRDFENKYDDNHLHIRDTDAMISKEYNDHIYNVYTSLYKERGDGNDNISDANEYIEKKEREILVKLTDECFESDKKYLIAPGPFLVTRNPQWGYFYCNIKPICYYLELKHEEVYDGLIKRRRELESKKIVKSKSFGCWDYNSITYYINGRYKELPRKIAIEYITNNMGALIKEYKRLSVNRIFSAVDIKTNSKSKKELYDFIKNDLLL